jgi:hypothetical protein
MDNYDKCKQLIIELNQLLESDDNQDVQSYISLDEVVRNGHWMALYITINHIIENEY